MGSLGLEKSNISQPEREKGGKLSPQPPSTFQSCCGHEETPAQNKEAIPSGMKLSVPRIGLHGSQREFPPAFPVQSPEFLCPQHPRVLPQEQGTGWNTWVVAVNLDPCLVFHVPVGTFLAELQRLLLLDCPCHGRKWSQSGQGWKTPLRPSSPATNTDPAHAGLSLARGPPHNGFLPPAA